MPNAIRLVCFPLLIALTLAGCSNAQPGNEVDLNDANAAAMDGPAEEENRVYPGSNAVAGDVIEGQEVMFYGGGINVNIIQLHPGQYYEFGRAKWEILAVLRNVRGQQTGEGTVPNCPGGGADYADFSNLRVYFRDDRFIGWDAAPGNPQFRDEWSFSIGMPRDDITDMGEDNLRIFNSSRGIEFEADGVRGLLSANRPDGVVIDLWAGDTCLRD